MSEAREQEGDWLTYHAIARKLGMSVDAARQLARRRAWPKQAPNRHNDPVRVLFPHHYQPLRWRPDPDETPEPSPAAATDQTIPSDTVPATIRDIDPKLIAAVITAVQANWEAGRDAEQKEFRATLVAALDHERAHSAELQVQIEQLQAKVHELWNAERTASDELLKLRSTIEARGSWGLLRRLTAVVRRQ